MNSKFYFLLSIFCAGILLSTFYFLFSVNLVEAAELFFEPGTQEIKPGEYFQADLFLDAQNEQINAIEGKIVFPSDLLEIKEILDGNSIINLWVEKARLQDNQVIFSGLIPGGFKGVLGPYYEGVKPGKILSLILKTKTTGEGVIHLKDARVLLNDGLGTPAKLTIKNLEFRIEDLAKEPLIFVPQKDTHPPELFEPIITQDPNVFDGKWFLVFVTQDKSSGIDHYEIRENRRQKIENRRWIEAESPYLLKDQRLRSWIYVKAVDRAGNERIEVVEPRYPIKWYEQPLIWIIIVLGVIAVYLVLTKTKNQIKCI